MKIKRTSDVLYGLISIDRKYEDILSLFDNELNRLNSLHQQGEKAYYLLNGQHNRLEQSYGLYYLINRMMKLFEEENIPISVNKSELLLTSLLRTIGHSPMSLSTEKGIIRAMLINPIIKKEIKIMFNTISKDVCVGKLRKCDRCKKRLFSNHIHYDFFKWNSAFLIKNKKSIQEKINEFNKNIDSRDEEISLKKLFKALICTNQLDHQILSTCNRIDYLSRDLHYSTYSKVYIDIDTYFLDAYVVEKKQLFLGNENILLDAIQDYLSYRIYHDPNAIVLELFFEIVTSELLSNNELSISELNEMDDQSYLDFLEENYEKYFNLYTEILNNSKNNVYEKITEMKGPKTVSQFKLLEQIFECPLKKLNENFSNQNSYVSFISEEKAFLLHNSSSINLSDIFLITSNLIKNGFYSDDPFFLIRFLYKPEVIFIQPHNWENILIKYFNSEKPYIQKGKKKDLYILDQNVVDDPKYDRMKIQLQYRTLPKIKEIDMAKIVITYPQLLNIDTLTSFIIPDFMAFFNMDRIPGKGYLLELLAYFKIILENTKNTKLKYWWLFNNITRKDKKQDQDTDELDLLNIRYFNDNSYEFELIEVTMRSEDTKIQEDMRSLNEYSHLLLQKYPTLNLKKISINGNNYDKLIIKELSKILSDIN